MAMGFEGSKGVLYNQQEGGVKMAVGFEGSKGILHDSQKKGGVLIDAAKCTKPRKEFQEAVFLAANRKIPWEDFISRIQILSPRMSVSAFVNSQCSMACSHCYLRTRSMSIGELPAETEIARISNELHAVDFSIVGMEPLETWERTRNILGLVDAKRKAIITNGVHLTKEVSAELAKSDILVDFSVTSPTLALAVGEKLADAGIKATASCIVTKKGADPINTIFDISSFGLPLVFFSCCDPSGKSESDALILNLIEDLRTRSLKTKVLVKVDFLSPGLLDAVWKKYFSGLELSDLRIDLDEGFLVRELAPNLLIGAYPFPGEFINRARIDADGALTTCYHMQLPLNERLIVMGDLRIHPEKWMDISDVADYHKNYWKEYFAR